MKKISFFTAFYLILAVCALAQTEQKVTEEFITDAYEQLSDLESVQDKRAWLTQQSAEVRVALWQKHFVVMLAENEYSKEQVEYISRLQKAMTLELVNAAGSENAMQKPVVQEFHKLMAEGQKTFSKEQFNQLTMNIGHKIKINKASYTGHTINPIPRFVAMPGIFRPPCNCHFESTCSGSCCAGQNCDRLSGNNCGCFWLFECNAAKLCLDDEFQ